MLNFLLQGHKKQQTVCNLVQWVIWCGDLAVKSRVHTTPD